MVQAPKKIRLPQDAYADLNAVFHVTIRTFPETAPFRNARAGDLVWQVVANERERTSIHLIAACLMPDHLHLVLSPRSKDLVSWVRDFKAYSTNVARALTGRRALWQPSFYDRRLRSEEEAEVCVGYVLRNPIDAGLVTEDEGWAWVRSWWEG